MTACSDNLFYSLVFLICSVGYDLSAFAATALSKRNRACQMVGFCEKPGTNERPCETRCKIRRGRAPSGSLRQDLETRVHIVPLVGFLSYPTQYPIHREKAKAESSNSTLPSCPLVTITNHDIKHFVTVNHILYFHHSIKYV